ncbi:MAG: hypothetical protein FGM14_15700 [Flavobacteriales bacterium]|nr:hypothetical protein [Flavobacteriales bacterium]
MSEYKNWNNALIEHFFHIDKNQEIILYCDEDLINDIGDKNKLGNINNFVNEVISEEKRTEIYDSYFSDRSGKQSVSINKEIRSSNGLKFSLLLFEKGKQFKIKLSYLSFLIISILKHTLTEERKSELKLDTIGNNPNGYNELFHDIHKQFPSFIARRIGKLAYEGLIRFQVVLNKREHQELEEILYSKNLQFSEDENYESILNRVIRYSSGSLRKKMESSISDECYKIWFENKFKSFDIEKYCFTNKIEKKSVLEGEFVLALILNADYKGLKLLTNVNPEESISNDFMTIRSSEINSRLENGFFLDTVNLYSKVEIKEYSFEDSNSNASIKSQKLNDVIILQQIKVGVYVQTINPYPNELTYTMVKKDSRIIEKFKVWCENKKIEIKTIDESISSEIIGNSFLIFESKNFHIPFYKIDNTNYIKIDNNTLQVKKIGGYRPIGTLNTYFDVALPQFKLTTINNFDASKLKVEFIRRDAGIKDRGTFSYNLFRNIINIFIEDSDLNFETIFIEVNIKYKENIIGSFNFGIEASKMKKLDDEKDFVKYNRWGVKAAEDESFYNTKTLSITDKIELNRNTHKLEGLTEDCRKYSDYFINILNAAFSKSKKNYQDKLMIKQIYESSLDYLNSHHENKIIKNDYTFFNLLKNLVDLGYLQKTIVDTGANIKEVFLAIPPTFSRIEKSFTPGGGQIFILTGLYSRTFIHTLKTYTESKAIKVKYRKFKDEDNRFADNFLLPDLIFIDHNFPLDEFQDYCKKLDLYFETESIHNVPNSLLNFVGSISDFEDTFLKLSELDIAGNNTERSREYEKSLEPAKEEEFPRLRILRSDKSYYQKSKYIEFKANEFLKVRNDQISDWLDIYIKFKRKEPFIIYEKIRSEGNFSYKPNIFIYKYIKLPSIFSKALTLMNIGIPSEHKLFIVNSKMNKRSRSFACNDFYKYNISDSIEKRKHISQVLTGSLEIEGNIQIIDSISSDNVKMKMEIFQSKSSNLNESFILIKNLEVTLAFIKLGNYSKPKSFFLNKNYFNLNYSGKCSQITINNHIITMVLIDNQYMDANKIISCIIRENIDEINFLTSNNTININLDDYSKENIKIINNY